MQTSRWTVAAATVALSFLLGGAASAQDGTAFIGSFETTGTYSNQRQTKAALRFERAADGKLSVTRVGRYSARRWRNVPAFTWTGEARVDGANLKVTYRLGTDGVGISNVIVGNPNAAAVANTFEAVYSLSDQGQTLTERLTNTTRKAPEEWWTSISTAGPRMSTGTTPPVVVDPPVTPPTDPVQAGRVKLGGSLDLTGKRAKITVVVPTDGTLLLTLSAGTLTLEDPTGKRVGVNGVAGASATETKLEVGHQAPVLGIYTATIEGSSAGAKLSAKFTQDGRIDARVRPWSSHTYYPIYQYSSDGAATENDNTMFKADGPLDKADKALSLTGKQSMVWWEKGTDYRTGFGFERGHYVRLNSPTEKRAERDWHADLDGDGVMETEDSAAAFKRYDKNSDGKVTREEAKAALVDGQIKVLWASYDKNGDGKVDATEIFASFVTSYDANNSKDIDATEWDKGLRTAYVSLLDQRTAQPLATLMARDKNADGVLDGAEIGQVGAVDFQDSSDVDGDFNSFFDRDNVAIWVNGTRHFGNKLEEGNGKVKLFKGRLKDQLVIEADVASVTTRETGIADGDLDDSYSVGWWGHCNAWSMASIVFRKPAADITSNGQTFSVRDQKALLVAYGMGDIEDSQFWWQQFGGTDIPVDKYAAGFHRQMHRWLRVEQKGMMADMDLKNPNNNLNFAVWNYPLIGYVAEMKEAAGDDPRVVEVTCRIEKGSYSDDDSSGSASVTYNLQFDPAGAITEGTGSKTKWTQGGDTEPQFIRYLIHPFRFTGPGTSRNPNVTEARLEQLFGGKLKLNEIEDVVGTTPTTGGLPPPGQ